MDDSVPAEGSGPSQTVVRLRRFRANLIEIASRELDPVSEELLELFDNLFPEASQ